MDSGRVFQYWPGWPILAAFKEGSLALALRPCDTMAEDALKLSPLGGWSTAPNLSRMRHTQIPV